MSHDSTNPPSVPYRNDPRYRLRAIGRWHQGGVLEVYFDGRLEKTFSLGKGSWCLLALLMDAAIRSAHSGWASAFMTTAELARGLYKHTRLGDSDPANVPRFVHRLRRTIAKHMDGLVDDPKQWSRRLIEHHPSLGYRISIPPPDDSDFQILGESP